MQAIPYMEKERDREKAAFSRLLGDVFIPVFEYNPSTVIGAHFDGKVNEAANRIAAQLIECPRAVVCICPSAYVGMVLIREVIHCVQGKDSRVKVLSKTEKVAEFTTEAGAVSTFRVFPYRIKKRSINGLTFDVLCGYSLPAHISKELWPLSAPLSPSSIGSAAASPVAAIASNNSDDEASSREKQAAAVLCECDNGIDWGNPAAATNTDPPCYLFEYNWPYHI